MAIQDKPHVIVPAEELAKWVERKPDMWWSVDGDPVLTARVFFPCPSDELAAAIRRVGRPLLVRDHRTPPAGGVVVTADALDLLARPLASALFAATDRPAWTADRLLDLAWQDGGGEWLLTEDSDSAAAARRDAMSGAV